MNNDLISREALKKALELTDYNDIYDLTICGAKMKGGAE